MAPLGASSGAATGSRQRPRPALLRAGVGRGRLRATVHLLGASGHGWAGRRLGGRSVGTVLVGRGATGDVQWRSRGFEVVA